MSSSSGSSVSCLINISDIEKGRPIQIHAIPRVGRIYLVDAKFRLSRRRLISLVLDPVDRLSLPLSFLSSCICFLRLASFYTLPVLAIPPGPYPSPPAGQQTTLPLVDALDPGFPGHDLHEASHSSLNSLPGSTTTNHQDGAGQMPQC